MRRLSVLELESLAATLSGLTQVHDPVAQETRLGDIFRQSHESVALLHAVTRRTLDRVHLDPAVSEAALARGLHTEASGLSRKFRQELGVTFVEYRARVRLMRFISRVDAGEPLTRAALAAEFGSYAQCHRVFRRALGCSPQAYFAGAREAIAFVTATVSPGF
jgi:AraC-like DNA-binding protein